MILPQPGAKKNQRFRWFSLFGMVINWPSVISLGFFQHFEQAEFIDVSEGDPKY